jgi:hypothetical protein
MRAPAGAVRCGAEGRFLKKAPQKLFWALRGARYGDSEVILVFLSRARGKRRPSHRKRKGKRVFLFLWLGLTENLQRRFSVSKMTRNQHQPFPEKFLEVSEPSFKKVLTAPVTGVSVTSSPTNPN